MFDMKHCVYCGYDMGEEDAYIIMSYHYDGKDAYFCRSCISHYRTYMNNQ